MCVNFSVTVAVICLKVFAVFVLLLVPFTIAVPVDIVSCSRIVLSTDLALCSDFELEPAEILAIV